MSEMVRTREVVRKTGKNIFTVVYTSGTEIIKKKI